MNLVIVLVFIWGVMIGSFINVIILRYQTGRITGTRSSCLSCNKPLSWFELIPLLSFVLLRRRCRGCQSLISWQYPLVELAMGILFVALAWQLLAPLLLISQLAFVSFLAQAMIVSVLVTITVYDINHKIISDQLLIITLVLVFAGQLLTNSLVGLSWWSGLGWTILSGMITALPMAVLWLASRGRWLGFGDVKLAVVLGSWLGVAGGLSALAVAFWSGAAVSVAWLLGQRLSQRKAGETGQLSQVSKGLTIKSEVPFAPFLVFGALVSLFWGIDVFSIKPLLILVGTPQI